MMQNEQGLTKSVGSWLGRQDDIWRVKIHGGRFQRASIPDFLVCVGGLFLAIELKHPNGKTELTPGQRLEFKKIARAGGWVLEARSLDEVKQMIGMIRKVLIRRR